MKRLTFALAVSFALLSASPSHAGPVRYDRGIEGFDGSLFANDGYVETAIRGRMTDPDTLAVVDVPFSVNFFGTVYDHIFINENGIISFGAPFSGTPRTTADLANTGVPLIALFFADADLAAPIDEHDGSPESGNAGLGYTDGINMFVTMTSTYQGSTGVPTLTNLMQAAFFASDIPANLTTDFTLSLNYNWLAWESGNLDGGVNGLGGIAPRIGISNGFGLAYEVAGSGVNGALLGDRRSTTCPEGSLSVACNDYIFNFIDGRPYIDGVAIFPVPEPGTLTLLALGLATLPLARRPRKS